jgi:hypothetical protein
VVACSDHNDVAWHLIQLHQQKGHYSLDLPGFVNITAFLSDRIELIKEQDAWLSPHVVEKFA